MPPQENDFISGFLRLFLVYCWGEILDDLLLSLVVVFEAPRIKSGPQRNQSSWLSA